MHPPIPRRVPTPTETQARGLGRGRISRAFNQALPWVFTVAVLAGGLGLVTDAFRMAMAKLPWPMVMAGGFSAAALAILLAVVLGPLLAILGSISAALTGPGWRRWIRPLPPLAVSVLLGLAITSVRHRQDPTMCWALVLATALIW